MKGILTIFDKNEGKTYPERNLSDCLWKSEIFPTLSLFPCADTFQADTCAGREMQLPK